MKTIYQLKLNFEKMDEIYESSRATIYKDNKYCYKIYNDKNEMISNQNIERLCAFEKRKKYLNQQYILPDKLIYDSSYFCGYRSIFLRDSHLITQHTGAKLCSILCTISLLLNNMHNVGAIFGDFHFGNILIDKYNIPYLFDFENIQIDNYVGKFISYNLRTFMECIGVDVDNGFILTEDVDKFSFLLDILALTFNKDVLDITTDELEKAKRKSYIYEEIDNIVKDVIKTKEIKDIPYFHEIFLLRKSLY